jgi:hypothetical protein
MTKPIKPLKLSIERFCQLYVTDKEFFGNGAASYMEAYGMDKNSKKAYNSARSAASQLLTNLNVLRRINQLIDESGLNETTADKQTLYLMLQNQDLSAKARGIAEFNKVRGRVKEKLEVNGIINGNIKHEVSINKEDRSLLKGIAEAIVKTAART